jgi:prolyl-tRNA editing enzyme YbaK/EbsC (Cys-tRNA(Pro) deacylase)
LRQQGFLIVMSAVKKADWKKIKAAGYKQLRMATEEEVRHRTGE